MVNEIAVDEMTYEQAFTALEEVVSLLETGKHSLEKTMALFERGQELTRRCTLLLDQAELKVQQLTGDTLTPFNMQG
jgi:exodeoxyribonuclease VII small subunit